MKLPRIRYLLHYSFAKAGVLFLACATAAYVSLIAYDTIPVVFSLNAAVGFAGLILLGVRYWPAIFLALYIVYILNHVPFIFVVFLSIGHALQAVVGAYLLKRFGFDTRLARARDIVLFIAVAFSVTIIVPTFGYAGIYILQTFGSAEQLLSEFSTSWSQWWIGLMVSIFVITPLIVHWQHKARVTRNREILERAGIFGFVIGISALLFWGEVTRLAGISLIYALLIPLMWAALRMGPRFMTISLVCISFFAVTGVFFDARELGTNVQVGQQLMQIEIFLLVISVIFLILVSSKEELRITNRKLVHNIRELKHTLDRLYTQDRAKNNFLAMIAHELRNPLAPITSHLELLKMKQYISPEGLGSVSIIENRIESLKRLLDDLLDISRIYENKIVLKKEIIDLRNAIISSVQNVSTSIATRKQELITKLPDEELFVKADVVRLEQIFTNLLYNSSKFTETGGHIEIEAKQEGRNIIITVKDDGYGMDPATLPRIFNSFYQGESSHGSSTTGLGIGLSLTRDLIRMHQGTITAKSEGLYKGSEFQVTLPVAKSHSMKSPEKETTMSIQETRKINRVLIVDDNKEAAEGIATLLEMSGFTVTYALSGTEALKKFTSFNPDALLLDIGLPDMSGYDVARTLRNEYQYDGVIVALSGYGQDSDVRKSHEAGCTDHLTKPARLADLLSVLK